MRVLETNGGGGLRFADAKEPTTVPGQLLIAVTAVSVNRGEAGEVASAPAGRRPGWDFAGVVAAIDPGAAAAGGLPVGTRVCGLAGGGAWAQAIAVAASQVAAVPDAVSDEVAACLPVAAVTADRLLDRVRPLSGRTVVVTGATGAVGGFAIQLAAADGGRVIAVARRPEPSAHTARTVTAIGDLDDRDDRVDVVLESVGGSSLQHAIDIVSPGGVVLSFGATGGEPASLPVFWFGRHHGSRLEGFNLFTELSARPAGATLSRLLALVASGELSCPVAALRDWAQAAANTGPLATDATGKTVLAIS